MPFEMVMLALLLIAGFYMAWSIGANDVANAMGTSVGSRALTLKQAVILAAILEFLGAFLFGSHVTGTIRSGIIEGPIFAHAPEKLAMGMLASLLAAGAWLQLASYFGWPVSTTHSIVGSLVGFGVIVGGFKSIQWLNVVYIFTSWIFSPLFGAAFAYALFSFLQKRIFYAPNPIAATYRYTPILLFIVFTTLSLFLFYNGLQVLEWKISFQLALFYSALVGAVTSGVSFMILHGKPTNAKRKRQEEPTSETIWRLEKAKKQLQKVQTQLKGEARFRASMLAEDIEALEIGLTRTFEKDVESSEYRQVEKVFAHLQIVSAASLAFAHGGNDVANAIGPLTAGVELVQNGALAETTRIPLWALGIGAFGIIIGLATWGWRVIETIGRRITELTPSRGFAAEFGAALTIVFATRLGLPVSTTHTLVGAVLGVGLARGFQAIDLSTTRDIALSWLITIPAGAFLASLFYFILQALIY